MNVVNRIIAELIIKGTLRENPTIIKAVGTPIIENAKLVDNLMLNPIFTLHGGAKVYGGARVDKAHGVFVRNADDILVAGFAELSAGNLDAVLLNLDHEGNINWAKAYGTSTDQKIYDMLIGDNGDIILVGTHEIGSASPARPLILKLDSDGNAVWGKTYGRSDDPDTVRGAASDGSGNLILVGEGDNIYNYAFLCMKVDPNGNLLWANFYGGNSYGQNVAVDPSGNIYAAGYTQGYGAGNFDIIVHKIAPDGTLIWSKTYGGTGYEDGVGITIDGDGDIIVAGSTDSFGDDSPKPLIFKIDSDGNLIWAKALENTGGELHDVTTDASGNIYATGRGIGVYKLDPNGNFIWGTELSDSSGQVGYDIALGTNGKVVAVGLTSAYGFGDYDMIVLRVDEDGGLTTKTAPVKTYNPTVLDVKTLLTVTTPSITPTTLSFNTWDTTMEARDVKDQIGVMEL